MVSEMVRVEALLERITNSDIIAAVDSSFFM